MSWSLVQSTATGSSAASSLAYSSNNTAGNLLVCVVVNFTANASSTVPTDTKSNTWNLAVAGHGIAIFYAMNCSAGANTVTPADHGSGVTYEIAEWSGGATSSALDQTASVASGTFPASVTTTANGELIIGVQYGQGTGGGGSSAPTITVGSGLTSDLNPIGTYVSAFPHGFAAADGYETQSSSGSFSMSKWSISGSDSPAIEAGAVATFKAASAVNGNASLTGLSLTSATGQPIAGAIPFGQALTSAQGSLFGSVTAPLTGASLTSATGQPIAGAIPFGQSLSATPGSFSATGNGNATLTGASLSSAAGALAATPSAILAGQALTSAEGPLVLSVSVPLSGQALSCAAGTAVGNAGGNPAGRPLAASQGNLFGYAGGYLLVQQAVANSTISTTSASQSVAFKFPNMAVGALFCLVDYSYSTGTNSEPGTRTVTDTQGNTWAELAHSYHAGSCGASLWMCSSPAAGANTVTASVSGSATWGFVEAFVFEFIGGASWAGDGNITAPFTTVEFINLPNFTTTKNRDLILGAAAQTGSIDWSAGTGFTLIAGTAATSGAVEWQLQTTASSSTLVQISWDFPETGLGLGQAVSAAQAAIIFQGQPLAAAQGSLFCEADVPLAGSALAATANAVSGEGDSSATLSGQSLAGAAGTLVGNPQPAISGASLSASEGTLSTGADGNASPAGLPLAIAEGFLSAAQVARPQTLGLSATPGTMASAGDGNASLSGQSCATAQGSVSASNQASTAGQGARLTTGQGLIVCTGNGNANVPLVSVGLLSALGALAPTGDGSVSVSGQAATIAAGSPTGADKEYALPSGLPLALTPGTMSPAGDGIASLLGNGVFIAQGSFTTVEADVGISGASLASAAGTLAATADGNATPISA